jgi:hypothetical protein
MTTLSLSMPAVPVFSAVLRSVGVASLLLASIVGAQAADDDEDFNAIARRQKDRYHVNDWRLGYTMLPAGANVSIMDKSDDTNPGNFKRDTNWDQTGRTGLTWMTPWSGVHENGDFILGIELSTNHCLINSSETSPELDLRTFQLTIHPGLAWLLEDNFHVEINPFVGAGPATYDLNVAGDGSSLYWEVGLRLGAFYTWDNGFQLGMQTGYMYGKVDGDLKGGGASYNADIEVQGLFMGIQIGYRL